MLQRESCQHEECGTAKYKKQAFGDTGRPSAWFIGRLWQHGDAQEEIRKVVGGIDQEKVSSFNISIQPKT
jgi:hypothetical protein